MKTRVFFAFAALAGLVFFGCGNEQDSSNSLSSGSSFDSSSSSDNSSNSGNGSSSSAKNNNSSSSKKASSSSKAGSSSSSSSSIAAQQYPTLVKGQSGVKEGWASRYWDACKPSCSWSDKPQAISGLRCKNCAKDGITEIAAKDDNKSACDKNPPGNAYTCYSQIPVKINENLAYAYAATPGDGNQCGKCYQIQFDGGFKHGEPYATHAAIKNKTLIVMSSNIGYDVSGGQFDIMIPGGGLGAFDAFSDQLNVNKSQLGANEGGFLADCETQLNWSNGTLKQYQDCLKPKCALFTNADLKAGCEFYADWAMAANNPTLLYKEVECPQYLVDNYKATKF